MNADVQKNRRERFELWRVAAGDSGLISVGNTAWLLDCSRQYVLKLLSQGRLVRRSFGGQSLILFSSVSRYSSSSSISTKQRKRLK